MKYKEQIVWLNNLISHSWAQGYMYTHMAIYSELYAQFGPGSEAQQNGSSSEFSEQFFGTHHDTKS